MESDFTPADAAAGLRDVEASRTALADRLHVGLGFFVALGSAVAVSIALAGTGFARQDMALVAIGAAVLVVVGAAQLWLVRRATGVWVSDLAHRVVLGDTALASSSFVLALLATVWAATAGLWWAVALLAVAGGAGYALSGRRWVEDFHADPQHHVGRELRVVLVVTLALAVVGLVALLLLA